MRFATARGDRRVRPAPVTDVCFPQMGRNVAPEQLPRHKELLFAVGTLGWASIDRIVSIQLVYFYIPPEDMDSCDGSNVTAASANSSLTPIFPPYVHTVPILVVLNTIVILASAGRIWDAVTDPLIASFSDRLRTRFGRRIPCMAFGCVPTAVACVLLFFPLVDDAQELPSGWNIFWLGLMQAVFFAALTLYVTPYSALLPELGQTDQQRLDLSMWCSIAFTVGAVLASAAPNIGRIFTEEILLGLRLGILVISIIGCVCMFVPVFAIDESRYAREPVSKRDSPPRWMRRLPASSAHTRPPLPDGCGCLHLAPTRALPSQMDAEAACLASASSTRVPVSVKRRSTLPLS